jgi:predicted aldo/keto reductase-like oxidoreductase
MAITQKKQVDFGKRSGLKCFPVSMGAMRLPEEEKAIPLVRQAIDAGMVYIDTSRGYGDSEIKLAKSLKEGYRQKVILSSKWSPWNLKVEPSDDTSADCTYRRIIDSMQRLEVEYIDFYQIWAISSPEHYSEAVRKGGMLDGIRRAMDEGLVGHTGFTTHDKPENISRYIDESDWCETILFTYNITNQTYKQVIAKAHKKGIATVVMNPLAGGMLAEKSPVLTQAVKQATDCDNPVEVAHRYLAADTNVDTILCGITKPEDVTSTIANFQKPALSTEEVSAVEQAFKKLLKENLGFCTGCKYCLPCPQGINIPEIMHAVYLDKFLRVPLAAKGHYHWFVHNPRNSNRSAAAAECTECGQCEEKCTQRLKITEHIKYANKIFGNRADANSEPK